MAIFPNASVIKKFILCLALFKLTNGLILRERPENISTKPKKKSDSSLSSKADDTDRRVLNMFGFTQRPPSGREFRVPKLMQHLYNLHMGDYLDEQQHKLTKSGETGFDLPPSHVTSRVNTARSFHHSGKSPNLTT